MSLTRPDWEYYLRGVAEAVSARASCPRASVGAVLTSVDHRILATGYNGAASGVPDCLTVGCTMEGGHCIRVIHAEQNAIATAARQGTATAGALMWVQFRRWTSANFKHANLGEHSNVAEILVGAPSLPRWGYMHSLLDFPCNACRGILIAAGIGKVIVWDIPPNNSSMPDYSTHVYIA